MLIGLKIENIAVIEHAELTFDRGLNILTGETGAGKSIVIDAINAVLGERTSRELIRSGAQQAKVVATFASVPSAITRALADADVESMPDASLVISRTLSVSGHSACRVNGCPVTATVLRELAADLITIHGQHDGQALLSPEKHGGFIDSLARNEDLRAEYKSAFHKLIKVKKELDALYDLRDEKNARLDYLNYIIQELTDADVHAGEREALNREKTLLTNSGKVLKALQTAYAALSDENGLINGTVNCAESLESASKYYTDAQKPAERLRGIAYELQDCLADVRALTDGVASDPGRLAEINDRLDQLFRLSMKYGGDEATVIKTLEESIAERTQIEVSDARISELEEELYASSDRVKFLAQALTESRLTAARVFETQVMDELRFLDMPKVRFEVHREETALTSRGADAIEFLISANPGQPPKPIAKIASGGELSRIMLAIKNVLSDADGVPTLIFDEIDAGVSGSAAEKIALKLEQLSRTRQIICVTHLGRIAAQADRHMKISKSVGESATYTEITLLDDDGRAAEIARINAGGGVTGLQLASAHELLARARKEKNQ